MINKQKNIILKYMKHKILSYWLNNKANLIFHDIINMVNSDISGDDRPQQHINVLIGA